jgi:tritrans,polycis-undecaprenyl-diphosphate synthase [geranylgeranyl-diphosphate specific]
VGAQRMEEILNHIIDNYPEIKEVTVWAFSTENFKRSEREKAMIFRSIQERLKELQKSKRVHDNRIKVNVVGTNLNKTPKSLRDTAKQTMEVTKDYGNRIFNIAVGYGGRFEIIRAAIKFAKWLKNKPIIKQITDEMFENFLLIKSPVDIVIRTGGEHRLSGFMLYQMAYSELFFSDLYWPDFTTKEFDKIMKEYYKRQRRFGE